MILNKKGEYSYNVIHIMWCKNNNCNHYDKDKNECTRIGKYEENKDKIGVCWMSPSEGEY
jgi:hypothetical protein